MRTTRSLRTRDTCPTQEHLFFLKNPCTGRDEKFLLQSISTLYPLTFRNTLTCTFLVRKGNGSSKENMAPQGHQWGGQGRAW